MLGRKSEAEPETGIRASKSTGDLSYIGSTMKIKGDCETTGRLKIDGHVTGNVRAMGLEVSSGGRVDGDVEGPTDRSTDDAVVIHGRVAGAVRGARVQVSREGSVDGGMFAAEAVVNGHVSGGIVAEHRLVLEETAVVEGDVSARRLALKEGGRVNGNIRMGETVTDGESAQKRADAGEGKQEKLSRAG